MHFVTSLRAIVIDYATTTSRQSVMRRAALVHTFVTRRLMTDEQWFTANAAISRERQITTRAVGGYTIRRTMSSYDGAVIMVTLMARLVNSSTMFVGYTIYDTRLSSYECHRLFYEEIGYNGSISALLSSVTPRSVTMFTFIPVGHCWPALSRHGHTASAAHTAGCGAPVVASAMLNRCWWLVAVGH